MSVSLDQLGERGLRPTGAWQDHDGQRVRSSPKSTTFRLDLREGNSPSNPSKCLARAATLRICASSAASTRSLGPDHWDAGLHRRQPRNHSMCTYKCRGDP